VPTGKSFPESKFCALATNRDCGKRFVTVVTATAFLDADETCQNLGEASRSHVVRYALLHARTCGPSRESSPTVPRLHDKGCLSRETGATDHHRFWTAIRRGANSDVEFAALHRPSVGGCGAEPL
jgi:hypothetical protein